MLSTTHKETMLQAETDKTTLRVQNLIVNGEEVA